MRRTLVVIGMVVAVALAVTPMARADWTAKAGLGQGVGASRVEVAGCHPNSQRPELSVTFLYDRSRPVIRMRAGDSIWEVIGRSYGVAIFGVIELASIESCTGTFLAREPKR